jgi:transcriptional antiterminator NusG
VLDEQENPSGEATENPSASAAPAGEPSHVEAAHAEPSVAPPEAEPAPEPVAESPAPASGSNGLSPVPPAPSMETPSEEPINKQWYILKVQSNREESIKEGLMRRVKMAGLEEYFGECIVPTEMVSEFKGGKKKVTKRKLYPGYLVVHMEINDDTWYVVRETPGIGDFTGSVGRPTPMAASDVQKILSKSEEKADEAPKLKISFKKGDRVKINEGTFENFEGDVDAIDEANGRVIVMINIFGRSTPVELEYWQIEAV